VRIPAMGGRRRLEFRSGDNASNPFIFLTAVLAAGLDGIQKKLEPVEPLDYDVGHLSDEEAVSRGIPLLPRNLPDALAALEADEAIAQALGPIIFQEFLKVKRTEMGAYNLHVHPWERKMYLETI
jgi:glutamine synthetase